MDLYSDAFVSCGATGDLAGWSVVDPILDDRMPLHEYEPSAWGPAEASRIMAGDGGCHNLGSAEGLDDNIRGGISV